MVFFAETAVQSIHGIFPPTVVALFGYKKFSEPTDIRIVAATTIFLCFKNGMNANHLHCIEAGRRYPQICILARLAIALGVSIKELVEQC